MFLFRTSASGWTSTITVVYNIKNYTQYAHRHSKQAQKDKTNKIL